MTLQSVYGPLVTIPLTPGGVYVVGAVPLIDAALESIQAIGYITLEGGTAGGSKTISSVAGKIHWTTGTVTFANAGTTLRVGIQDVSTVTAPAQGDGTFDVYKDLIGATDVINSSVLNTTAMATGTKTLTHGQLISIAFTLTARAGTDSVAIRAWDAPDSATQLPATMLNTAAFVRQAGVLDAILEFDDGTLGWITGTFTLSAQSTVAFNLGTAGADEYGNLIIPRFSCRAVGIQGILQPASASADVELCLYSDPLGTPALIEAITVDATQLGHSTSYGMIYIPFATERTLVAGTTYGITVRPTTANNATLYYHDVADSRFWKVNTLGTDCYAIKRLDNAGAFADYNGGTAKTRRLWLSLLVDQFDDGVGGGGAAGMKQSFMNGNFSG